MKTFSLSMGQKVGYVFAHPERTAGKTGPGAFSDTLFKVFPTREDMTKAIRAQQKRAHRGNDWFPVVALTDGEGY